MTSSTTGNDNDQQYFGDSSGDMTSSKKESTSCEQNNNVDNITADFNNMAVQDDKSKCASWLVVVRRETVMI